MPILRKMKIQKFKFCTLIHPAKIFKDADLFTDKKTRLWYELLTNKNYNKHSKNKCIRFYFLNWSFKEEILKLKCQALKNIHNNKKYWNLICSNVCYFIVSHLSLISLVKYQKHSEKKYT